MPKQKDGRKYKKQNRTPVKNSYGTRKPDNAKEREVAHWKKDALMREALKEQLYAGYDIANALGLTFYPADKKLNKGSHTGWLLFPLDRWEAYTAKNPHLKYDVPKGVSPEVRIEVRVRNFASDYHIDSIIEKSVYDKVTRADKRILYCEVYTDRKARIWDLPQMDIQWDSNTAMVDCTVVKGKRTLKKSGRLQHDGSVLLALPDRFQQKWLHKFSSAEIMVKADYVDLKPSKTFVSRPLFED